MAGNDSCAENITMLEAFEWFAPVDHAHWQRLRQLLPTLKSMGIDNLWLPPGCKAGWHGSNGYDIYDLYDLGEFDQKDSILTKWGSKADLLALTRAASENGLGIYWDAVLNHKAAADYVETCDAVQVDPMDRTREISGVEKIETWTGYRFDGRRGKYSTTKYDWTCFSGTDYEARTKTSAIYKFVGEGKPGWATDVDREFGNADYLYGKGMYNNVDFSQSRVKDDMLSWGSWICRELNLSGFRFDAVKHFSAEFMAVFMRTITERVGDHLFFVGEYWSDDLKALGNYLKITGYRMSLFDVPLVGNIARLSTGEHLDLRTIFRGTLAKHHPANAVTFVQNHDTQDRDREFAIPVEAWFIPLAYSLTLLYADCGYPCVFYGDLFGCGEPMRPVPQAEAGHLAKLILARKLYAYGEQLKYFDRAYCVGFTRAGHPSRSGGAGLAVLMNTSFETTTKKMYVGLQHRGEHWTNILDKTSGATIIDRCGWAVFSVNPRAASVWIDEAAEKRDLFNSL